MSGSQPLLVPMTVEAFVVNDPVRLSGNPFMRTHMDYPALRMCANAQASISGNDPNFTSDDLVNNVPAGQYYNGVYLKWRMPDALTRGAQDPVSGLTTYPPVPNRWLIVRMNGAATSRRATAWIVESDYVWPAPPSPVTVAGEASLYVGEQSSEPVSIRIGRNVELGGWTESGDSLHLTAVAPGNPAFAFYQPQNNNVFSFVDVLGDGPDDTLSYQVLGWFSDAQDDPLAGVDAGDFATALAALNWTLPPGTDPSLTTQTTFLLGSVCDVTWQTAAAPAGGTPGGDPPMSISMGNTSAEALTAMVAAQAAHLEVSVDADLLEAFQLGLLNVLDEPDGAALLAEKLRASFFQRYHGGYGWTIVDAPGSTETISSTERAKESAWLATLCGDQDTLDDALRELAALQAQLYVAWWKYVSWPWLYNGGTTIHGLDDQSGLQNLIDPSVQGSIAQQTANQLQKVQGLAALVPSGTTPKALHTSIAAYGAQQQLPDCRILKRTSTAPFHLPNDPVVLIAGAGASGIVGTGGTALCRFSSQLVTAFTYDDKTVTASTLGQTIAQPDLSAVSGVPWTTDLAASLVVEFFLTDPVNAAAISAVIPDSTPAEVQTAIGDPASYTGAYPAGGVLVWAQNPWHPLLLIWQVTYYPIDYGTPDAPNWTFQDGAFVWNGTPQSVQTAVAPGGLIQLSTTAAVNMKARIQAFLRNTPGLDPQEAEAFQALLDFVQTHDSWDLLSQSLNGFNEQLRLGMAGVFLSPGTGPGVDPSLPDLIGDVDGYPAALPAIPSGAIPPSTFQPWRAGQFSFLNLLLVDEWGQALWPIDPDKRTTETVYLPPGLTPVRTSEPVTFTITAGQAPPPPSAAASGPVITQVSPNLIQAGTAPSAQIPVTITGSGFGSDSVVSWDDIALTATVAGSTEITCSVPADFVREPGSFAITVTSGGVASPAASFTVSAGPAIGVLDPQSVVAGAAAFTLTATGAGFAPQSVLAWNGAALDTTYVSPAELTAQVPADLVATAGTADVTEVFGHRCVDSTATYVQLPPALLQPARLDFDLLSATDDTVKFGPAEPGADPVCGWVLPDHLDASLMAYDAQGTALGEMSVGYDASDQPDVYWTPLPGSPYPTLDAIADAIPHFGSFLKALAQQGPATFTDFLHAIDETLWTTAPMGAVFDQNLAVLMGRPLAMVRAQLQFELDGSPYADPSWQFTFEPAQPAITGYRFPIELGNLAQLGDGLIGYFTQDDYSCFNVVQQAVTASSGYLAPIGVNDNYLYLPFDGTTAEQVSMLVDPRAAVHATTAVLPTVKLALPPQFVTDALAAMNVIFRVDGGLTDRTTTAAGVTTVLIPTPKEKNGAWSWVEKETAGWTSYTTGPNGATARLSTVAPVLRRGLLHLSSALKETGCH